MYLMNRRLMHVQLFVLSCSGQFDRQDSLRSDYLSDRETRYGIVQQASIDSTDSRLCYLTSSEVGAPTKFTAQTDLNRLGRIDRANYLRHRCTEQPHET